MARKINYSEKRRESNKNTTEARLVLDNTKEGVAAAAAHANQFFSGQIRAPFDASSAYGLQHVNQEGAAHPNCLNRMSNETLALLGVQVIEVLSRRSAQRDNTEAFVGEFGEGVDPATAQKVINLLRKVASERPKAVRQSNKDAVIAAAEALLQESSLPTVTSAPAEEVVPA